jgi:hypothetical protein
MIVTEHHPESGDSVIVTGHTVESVDSHRKYHKNPIIITGHAAQTDDSLSTHIIVR